MEMRGFGTLEWERLLHLVVKATAFQGRISPRHSDVSDCVRAAWYRDGTNTPKLASLRALARFSRMKDAVRRTRWLSMS